MIFRRPQNPFSEQMPTEYEKTHPRHSGNYQFDRYIQNFSPKVKAIPLRTISDNVRKQKQILYAISRQYPPRDKADGKIPENSLRQGSPFKKQSLCLQEVNTLFAGS
ncbi:hypothetical protein ACIXOK_18700 [Bacteroides fragilis]